MRPQVRQTRKPHHKKKKEPVSKTLGLTPNMKKNDGYNKRVYKNKWFFTKL